MIFVLFLLLMEIGRAGKTTLSNMIKEKYNNYSLIHSNSIKWALIIEEGEENYYCKNIYEFFYKGE